MCDFLWYDLMTKFSFQKYRTIFCAYTAPYLHSLQITQKVFLIWTWTILDMDHTKLKWNQNCNAIINLQSLEPKRKECLDFAKDSTYTKWNSEWSFLRKIKIDMKLKLDIMRNMKCFIQIETEFLYTTTEAPWFRPLKQ